MYFSEFIEDNKRYTNIPENISLEKFKSYRLGISSFQEYRREYEISFDSIKHVFLNEVFSLLQISFDLNKEDSNLKKFTKKLFTTRYYEQKPLKALFEYYFDRIDSYNYIEIIPNENFEFYINNENILVINIRFKTSEISEYIYKY